jgi:AcrR family transcriptional regulator
VAKRGGSRVDRRTLAARAEGRDAREALLDAALAVFAERGYRDATVDAIAERAGFSKGALYWHFKSKDELLVALLDERLDRPWREGTERLESAPADVDMAPDASERFAAMIGGQGELVLLDQEYWALAVRDPKLRARYAKRERKFRKALGRAIAARIEHLGAPPLEGEPEELATLFMAVGKGLVLQKLIDDKAVPSTLLGDAYGLLYAGQVARSEASAASKKSR